jgi:hypothetical protein
MVANHIHNGFVLHGNHSIRRMCSVRPFWR